MTSRVNLENDSHNPEHGSTPSPLRLAARGRFPEDKVRPSKEFCSTWTADLQGDGELGALGDSGLLGAGAVGCWGGQGGVESWLEMEAWTQMGSRFW